jgi:thioredoxin-like negative regulator of GroEL
MGIPALILFKDGKVVHQLQGNQPKQRIVDQLESHIG